MIWVDADGVLADFVRGYLDGLQAEFEIERTHADVTEWDLVCLSDAGVDEGVKRWLVSEGRIAVLPDIEGAVAGLAALRGLGTVGCVTSPMYRGSFVMQRRRWLLDRGFTDDNIVFATDKRWVAGAVLVDDKLENCIAWQAANPYGLAIVFDQPWNQSPDESIVRAMGWTEVVSFVSRWKEAPHAAGPL